MIGLCNRSRAEPLCPNRLKGPAELSLPYRNARERGLVQTGPIDKTHPYDYKSN